MAPSSPTALLLFTRTPEEEARHKQFVPAGRHVNRRIACQLIRHTTASLQKAGIPVYVITSAKQRGRTFGERLAAAFQEIFNLGYMNVIAVGNDTLTLTSKDLQDAAHLLERRRAVVGPTRRGGTYLIGLHRDVFNQEDFAQLPWESEILLDSLLDSLDAQISLLKCQQDINNAADFYAAAVNMWECAALLKAIQRQSQHAITLTHIDRPTIPRKDILRYFSHRSPPLDEVQLTF